MYSNIKKANCSTLFWTRSSSIAIYYSANHIFYRLYRKHVPRNSKFKSSNYQCVHFRRRVHIFSFVCNVADVIINYISFSVRLIDWNFTEIKQLKVLSHANCSKHSIILSFHILIELYSKNYRYNRRETIQIFEIKINMCSQFHSTNCVIQFQLFSLINIVNMVRKNVHFKGNRIIDLWHRKAKIITIISSAVNKELHIIKLSQMRK